MAELLQEDRDNAVTGDVLTAILRKWWVVLLCAACGGGGGYAVSKFLLPPAYESQGTVFVQQSSPLAGILRELPASVVGRTGDSSGYLMTVLQSDTMIRRVSDQMGLARNKAFTGGEQLSEERAQRALKRSLSIRQDKNGAVTVAARTGDPELCKGIVNHVLDNLRNLYETDTQRRSKFIDGKLAAVNKRLVTAEDALLAFQNTHNLALIDEQTKNVVAELGDLDGQLMTQKVELEQVRVELENGGDPEELVKLRVRQKALETSTALISQRIDTVRRALANAPTIAVRYARLQRTVAMLSRTAEMLAEQAEISAMTQHGENGDYRVVDWAQVKQEPVGPRNAVNAAIGAALLAFIGMAAIAAGHPSGGTPRGDRKRASNQGEPQL